MRTTGQPTPQLAVWWGPNDRDTSTYKVGEDGVVMIEHDHDTPDVAYVHYDTGAVTVVNLDLARTYQSLVPEDD